MRNQLAGLRVVVPLRAGQANCETAGYHPHNKTFSRTLLS
jgi:hypothetical protein